MCVLLLQCIMILYMRRQAEIFCHFIVFFPNDRSGYLTQRVGRPKSIEQPQAIMFEPFLIFFDFSIDFLTKES